MHRAFFVAFFIWVLYSIFGVASTTNALRSVKIEKSELQLLFTKSLKKSHIKRKILLKPVRYVYDFQKTVLLGKRRNLAYSDTKKITVSQFTKDIVRVVIAPKKSYKSYGYIPLMEPKRYHITLPKSSFLKAASNSYLKPKVSKKRSSRRIPTKNNTYTFAGELVVIDAGHGGHDSGAVAGGKKEKDLVLQIAKRVERELKKRGLRVYMTRRSDRFLKLSQRTKIADKKGATVFVSIHANSVPKRNRHKAYGIETYFLQNTRDAKSMRIAARENAAVLKGTGKLSKRVIVDAVLNGPKIIESNKLAIDVQRGMIQRLRSRFKDVKDNGVRHAPFWVLVGASRPSILIEVGYISHPKERKRLFNPTYQELLAKGIADGIVRYILNHKKEIGEL